MECQLFTWYVLLRFDGAFVTGFIVVNQPDKESVLKHLKKMMLLRILRIKEEIKKDPDCVFRKQDLGRYKSFMKCLKYPWRVTKERFAHRSEPVVQCIKWDVETALETDYWISDLLLGNNLCNLKDTYPRETFERRK